MTRRRNTTARPGFTLLEMILSGAIGVLLLGALYVAMGVQVQQTQAARDAVEQAKLARALLERIGQDLAPAPGTPDPSRFRGTGSGSGGSSGTSGSGATSGGTASAGTPGGTSSASGGTSGATGGTTAGGSTNTGGSAGGSSSGGTSGTAGSSSAASGASATSSGAGATGSSSGAGGSSGSSTGSGVTSSSGSGVFAVQGDSSTITLFVNRLGRQAQATDPLAAAAAGTTVTPSDLRRVTYWLIPGGSTGVAGLARMEEPCVTTGSDGLAVPDTAADNQVVAEEVRSLSFSYFDGTTWQDTWDGTTPGSDGMTPLGPPMAIAITIGLVPPGQGEAGEARLKLYRHVVALPTANGATQVQASSDGTTTSSGNTP